MRRYVIFKLAQIRWLVTTSKMHKIAFEQNHFYPTNFPNDQQGTVTHRYMTFVFVKNVSLQQRLTKVIVYIAVWLYIISLCIIWNIKSVRTQQQQQIQKSIGGRGSAGGRAGRTFIDEKLRIKVCERYCWTWKWKNGWKREK